MPTVNHLGLAGIIFDSGLSVTHQFAIDAVPQGSSIIVVVALAGLFGRKIGADASVTDPPFALYVTDTEGNEYTKLDLDAEPLPGYKVDYVDNVQDIFPFNNDADPRGFGEPGTALVVCSRHNVAALPDNTEIIITAYRRPRGPGYYFTVGLNDLEYDRCALVAVALSVRGIRAPREIGSPTSQLPNWSGVAQGTQNSHPPHRYRGRFWPRGGAFGREGIYWEYSPYMWGEAPNPGLSLTTGYARGVDPISGDAPYGYIWTHWKTLALPAVGVTEPPDDAEVDAIYRTNYLAPDEDSSFFTRWAVPVLDPDAPPTSGILIAALVWNGPLFSILGTPQDDFIPDPALGWHDLLAEVGGGAVFGNSAFTDLRRDIRTDMGALTFPSFNSGRDRCLKIFWKEVPAVPLPHNWPHQFWEDHRLDGDWVAADFPDRGSAYQVNTDFGILYRACVLLYEGPSGGGGLDLCQTANGWLHRAYVNAAGELWVEKSVDAGATWAGAVVATDPAGAVAPSLYASAHDDLFVWYHTESEARAYRSLDLGATWTHFLTHAGYTYPSAAPAPDGQVYFALHAGTELRIFAGDDDGPAVGGEPLATLDIPEGPLMLRCDRNGFLHLIYSDGADVFHRKDDRTGTTWTAPATFFAGTLPALALGAERGIVPYQDGDGLAVKLTTESYDGVASDGTAPTLDLNAERVGVLIDHREDVFVVGRSDETLETWWSRRGVDPWVQAE